MKLALSRGRPVLCLALAGALVFAVRSAQATPGALDPSFGTGGEVTTTIGSGTTETEVEALAVQPDGKIVAVGNGGNGSDWDFALARYNPNGSLDTSFDGDGKVLTGLGSGDDLAWSLALQPDGKIVVAGRSRNKGADWDFALARYNPNGSLDTSFGPDHNGKVRTDFASSNDEAFGVALQPDGKIVVAGGSYTVFPHYSFAVARYNLDGSLDTTFKGTGKVTTSVGGTDDQANKVALQPDGKIVTAGQSWNGSDFDFALVRYKLDGSLDTSFNATGKLTTAVGTGFDYANAVALQPDGKIVAAGSSVNTGANSEFALVRYLADGSPDTSFGSGGKVRTAFSSYGDSAAALALQPDGKIVAAGTSSGRHFALARYNPNGSLDTSFDGDGKVLTGPGYNGSIYTFLFGYAVALQPDGKIVAAGAGWTSTDSSWEFVLARYLGSTLTVSKAGSGAGTVASSPSGIDCGSSCSAPFAALPVTLTATAASGSSFSGWSGDCSGKGTCELSMSADHVATATFESDKTLTVANAGSGSGTVTSSPGGIDCGSTCAHAYTHGTSVTLTATGGSGSTFTGWSGDCSGTGTCALTMSAGHAVTATFKRPPVKCHVPKVKGKTLKQAKKKIRAAHCKLGKVTKASSKKVKKGRVISQKPKPGVTKPAGAKVALKVSTGKKK